VQDCTGRYVQKGERNCLELIPDFSILKRGGRKSQTRNNSNAYTLYDAKKKSKPIYQWQQRPRMVT